MNLFNLLLASLNLYDADAKAYFIALSSQPSLDRKILYNNLIKGLKADVSLTGTTSNWDELDYLRINAAQTENHALTDIRKPTRVASKVGSPSFATDLGYTYSSGNYINTNFNPVTNGIKFVQNSASCIFYSRTNIDSTGFCLGISDASSNGFDMRLRTTNFFNGRANNAGSAGNSAVTDSFGLCATARTASNTVKRYKKGSLLNTFTNTSTALVSLNFFEGCSNANGVASSPWAGQGSVIAFSSGNLDQTKFWNRIYTFLAAFDALYSFNGSGLTLSDGSNLNLSTNRQLTLS